MNRVSAEVFPPGEFLRDELDARGWTQAELAEIIGRPARLVNEIIAGKRGVTPDTAMELAAAFGTSPNFWMNLESVYQLSKARLADEKIARSAKLRERFPIREMLKRGWLQHTENFDVMEAQVLRFFGLSAIDDERVVAHAARRNHDAPLSMIQTAWIARVRQLASAFVAPSYSASKFDACLSNLEALMTEPEEVRHVPRVLTEAGIRFVVVEPFPGSKIDGVCLWLNDRQPVVGLSLRLDRIDNFWFVLRHELEHVREGHGKLVPMIDELDEQGIGSEWPVEEQLANSAAADFCVPKASMDDFVARLHPFYSDQRLRGFSRIVDRHPGIVAGQLRQRVKRYDLFSKYLVRVRAHVIESALTDGYGRGAPVDI